MTERELSRDLKRLIRGELSSREVQRIAQTNGFQSFAELCESKLPEELDRIDISTSDLITRIDRYRNNEIDLQELWQWADELYNISFNHRITYEAEQEDLILTALSVLSVICNTRLFPVSTRTTRALEYLRAALVRRGGLELRHIFRRAFDGLPVAHLATKAPDPDDDDDEDEDGDGLEAAGDVGAAASSADGEASAGAGDGESGAHAGATEAEAADGDVSDLGIGLPELASPADFEVDLEGGDDDGESDDRFADVVLLDRPFDPANDLSSQYSWVIAFSVVTKDLFLEELRGQDASEGDDAEEDARGEAKPVERSGSGRPPAAPRHARKPEPEPRQQKASTPVLDDRVPYLKRLAPNFNFARYNPVYVCDGDGIAEIALDAPAIGPDEVRYAAKLFALNNRLGKVYLGGQRLKTLQLRPLGEKRRRRRPRGDGRAGR